MAKEHFLKKIALLGVFPLKAFFLFTNSNENDHIFAPSLDLIQNVFLLQFRILQKLSKVRKHVQKYKKILRDEI